MATTDDITIILRASGERTESLAYHLLSEAFPSLPIFTVKEVPFSKTLTACFRLALDQNKSWVLMIDADVLIDASGIQALMKAAANAPSSVFELQGLVFDRFFATERPAGNHLYRTKYLAQALELIPAEGTSLRPESSVMEAMKRQGVIWSQTPIVIGIHDFEQYYKDIYRKNFLQGKKHILHASYLKQLWESLDDPDFAVCLAGFNDGAAYSDTVFVSKDFGVESCQRALAALGLSEKKDLKPSRDPIDLRRELWAEMAPEQRSASLDEQLRMYPHAKNPPPFKAWRRRIRHRLRRLIL